jgi:hypothetical protein
LLRARDFAHKTGREKRSVAGARASNGGRSGWRDNQIMRGENMKKAFWLAGAAVLALAQSAHAGDTIKIGFV